MSSILQNATLETLKEWYEAGAQGKGDKLKIKKKLKTLIKIDPNPTIGETLKIKYASPKPALIFKQGNFEARMRLDVIDEFLARNWNTLRNGNTLRTPKEWLKENIVGKQGKFLATSKEEMFLAQDSDKNVYAIDDYVIVKVETKKAPPEDFIMENSINFLNRHLTSFDDLATSPYESFMNAVNLLKNCHTLEFTPLSKSIKVTGYAPNSEEGVVVGVVEIPAQVDAPTPVRVNPKRLHSAIKHLNCDEIHLFFNETVLSINENVFIPLLKTK